MLIGWNFKRVIHLTISGGGLVILVIGETTGGDFNLGGLSSIFPSTDNTGDLRFTLTDDTIQAMEVTSVTGSAPNRIATVNILVNADLSINQDLYCYFGNPLATNINNPNIGTISYNFENNSLAGWTFSGNANWIISSNPHTGVYAAQSGSITNSQTSGISRIINAIQPSVISFWESVSGTSADTILDFYINGVNQYISIGGVGAVYQQQTFIYIPTGSTKIEWIYSQNASNTLGAATGYVDDILITLNDSPLDIFSSVSLISSSKAFINCFQ